MLTLGYFGFCLEFGSIYVNRHLNSFFNRKIIAKLRFQAGSGFSYAIGEVSNPVALPCLNDALNNCIIQLFAKTFGDHMPQTLAEANGILVELARLEKDMVAVAGLHGEQLAARQAEMSSNLKCIVGCIYAKELITAISEASGVKRVAFVGRELGELPLGWYTPLVLGSDAKMFRPIWINVGCLIVNPPPK